jgi:UDPglucose 6-dehydrogenase
LKTLSVQNKASNRYARESMAQIAVVGTGYVGLTTGACLALLGHDVVCVDINESKINMLKQGTVEIVEDQLQEITRDMMFKQRLRFQFEYDSRHLRCAVL